MFTDAKILLSIELQGGTLIRESKATKVEWALTLGEVKPELSKKKLPAEVTERVVRRGRIKHYPLTAKPARKVVCLGDYAYDYMISANSYEGWMLKEKGWTKRGWVKMEPMVRLQYHLERISQHYGGKSFTFQVLE